MPRLVRGATDEHLERRFGNTLAQRAISTGMARQFEPKFAFGFEGDIAYELAHHGNSKPTALDRPGPRRRRHGAPGRGRRPVVTFRLTVPDFARLVTQEVDPQELLFAGRFHIEGDLALATRVPEMFGAAARF